MRLSITGCLLICLGSLSALAQVSGGISTQPPIVMQCSPEEASQIRRDAEQDVLNRIRQDMRVEGRVVGSALGYDERDCLSRATDNANYRRNDALRSCETQAQFFKTCEITQNRVVEHPTRIIALSAIGQHDERKTTEESCRITAQNRAIQNALNACQSKFGTPCRIISGPEPASFRIEKRRRYGIAGPKEDYLICESRAAAIPDSNLQFQCSVELVARVIPR